MASLVDSSLWVDFARAKSPPLLKRFVTEIILEPETVLAEPVRFELLAYATDLEARRLDEYFANFDVLETPSDLWAKAISLGRSCRGQGKTPGALDLLIATVAIDHKAELVTFDGDFLMIAEVSDLQVRLLKRPE